MKKSIVIIGLVLIIVSCHKEHERDAVCNPASVQIQPFLERYADFSCGGNLYEYTYIYRRSSQIDSLTDCSFVHSVPYPLDETNMVYIMVGRFFYYYGDTFQTKLWRDDCAKTLTYEVNRIQRDTIRYVIQYSSIDSVVASMFVEVDSIPSDYQVVVNYNYVPLGQ